MWTELGLRFVIGGVMVSLFALLGDIFKPKSFAGLFSASPSIALATLGLTFLTQDGNYLSLEGRSMLAGAIALVASSCVISYLMMRRQWHSLGAGSWGLLVWFGVAFGLWVYLSN
jgi:di/tricarboxylate transporter